MPSPIIVHAIADRPGNYHCTPGDAWGQGFATYGGFVAASHYRAALDEGHDRPLLSAQVNYLAPSPCEGYRIEVESIRVGKGTSIVETRGWAANRKDPDGPDILACKILWTYGLARGSSIDVRTHVEPETLERLSEKKEQTADFPHAKGIIPDFMKMFHFRGLEGAVPYSNGNALGHVFGLKPRNDWSGMNPTEFLMLVSDINPPPQLGLLRLPANASSMTWMCDLAQPLPQNIDPNAWHYDILQQEHAQNGYGAHSGVIVDTAGQVLTSNRQVTAVFETDNGEVSVKNLPNRLAFKAGFSLFRAFAGLRQRLAKK